MRRMKSRSVWGLSLNTFLKTSSVFPKPKFSVKKPFLIFLLVWCLQHPLILNFLLFFFPNILWALKTWGGKQAETISKISKIHFDWLKLLFVGGTGKIIIIKKFHFVVSLLPTTFPPYLGREPSEGQNVLYVAEAKNKSNFLHPSIHVPSKKIQKAGEKTKSRTFKTKGVERWKTNG